MFISYVTENSYSFWQQNTLTAVAKRSCKERLIDATFEPFAGARNRLLKVMTIYGSNASGKSNLLHSLFDMINRITSDGYISNEGEAMSETPYFFDPDGAGFKKPTFHELTFQIEACQYRYGYMAANKIQKEWLYKSENGTRKEKILFLRNENGFEVNTLQGADELIQRKTRSDTLFLAVCSRFAVSEAESIVDYLAKCMYVVSPGRLQSTYTARMLEGHILDDKIKSFMIKIDPSIGDITVTKEEETSDKINPDGKISKRQIRKINIRPRMSDGTMFKGNVPFSAIASDGTQKAFCLAGPIFRALESGGAIFIDELSAKFHPHLSLAIIHLFNSKSSNPHNAQLIFTSHDTSLLGQKVKDPSTGKIEKLFRRDQICIVEKSNAMSNISRLSDKAHGFVRKDVSLEKAFLDNTFGGSEKICFL